MTATASRPVRLRLLGPVESEPPITGPRRIAVLAYLALARPHGVHSRDTLIGLLWPEADQNGGRHALRNALHAIRQALGPVIVTSGDAMIGIDPELIQCDALELEADLAARRSEEAVARYHGELLQGFFVSDAPEFERWLDAERRRIADAVRDAAWAHADGLRAAGDRTGSMAAARRAAALAPDDEPSVRHLMQFLGDQGDRAGAMRAYEEFAERLRIEYEAEASAETQALAKSLREAPSDAELRAAAPPPRQILPRDGAPPAPPVVDATSNFPHAPRTISKYAWLAGATLTLAAAAAVALVVQRASAADPSKRLVVLPMANETGDTSLAYVASGVAEGVGRRLEGLGGLRISSAARAQWSDSVRHDIRGVANRYGARFALRSTLVRTGDSLELRTSLIQSDAPDERQLAPRRFALGDLASVESEAAAAVAAALFRAPVPEVPRAALRAVDPESYRLTLLGFHQLLSTHDPQRAQRSFERAAELDPTNARAYAGLSSTYAGFASTAGSTFDLAADHAVAAAKRALALDPQEGTALVNLGFVQGLVERNLSAGMPRVLEAERVDPSNPEVFLVASALLRHAWQWDRALDAVRIARRLDPLSPYYLEREAVIDLCADRFDDALRLADEELALSPANTAALDARKRTLALLGRPEPGYWEKIRADGVRRLTALRANASDHPVQDFALLEAQFAAGDTTAGFATLERLAATGERNLYKLPCMPTFDQVRNTPHLQVIIRKFGPLPEK
jgi:serine/threonine-protein kinase